MQFKEIKPDDTVNIKGGEKFVVVERGGLLPDGRLMPMSGFATTEEWETYVRGHVDKITQDASLSPAQVRQKLQQLYAMPDAFKGKSQAAAAAQWTRHVQEMMPRLYEKADSDRKVRLIKHFKDTVANMKLVLQANETSRVHKFQEGEVYRDGQGVNAVISFAHAFVVRHDWLGVLGDTNPELNEWELPYDDCLFEYKVDGHVCLVHVTPDKKFTFFVEVASGCWYCPTPDYPVLDFLRKQVAAACVVIEAEVATHTVVRQDTALQAKRKKAGRPLLQDFHILDLNHKRSRVSNAAPAHEGEKGKKRLHFCRGHWRQYATHRTRIPWCLKGNPELGFVDKMYRL